MLASGHGPLGQVLGRALVVAAPALGADPGAHQCRVRIRRRVVDRAGERAVPADEHLGQGVLDEVLGAVGVAAQHPGRPVELGVRARANSSNSS